MAMQCWSFIIVLPTVYSQNLYSVVFEIIIVCALFVIINHIVLTTVLRYWVHCEHLGSAEVYLHI